MGLHLPADVTLEPMPTDFTANITQQQNLLKATISLQGRRYEVGIQGIGTAEEVSYLKNAIWELKELDRLGRQDLMAYASVDRHKRA